MRTHALALLASAALLLVAPGSGRSAGPAQPQWFVHDLGTLGGIYGRATDVNAAGQVVGISKTATGSWHVFLWSKGRMVDLGGSRPDAGPFVNERGQVAWHERGAGAVVWENGRTTRVSRLQALLGLNERGQMVGDVAVPGGTHAALWDGKQLRELVSGPGHLLNEGVALNDDGVVVGIDGARAFIWRNGVMRDLAVPVGFAPPGTGMTQTMCQAVDVNDRGDVLGWCADRRPMRAFLWTSKGVADLGAFLPIALNDRGDVIGYHGSRTLVWRDGHSTDVGTLGGGCWAYAVNESGQVAGESRTRSGAMHGFVWEHDRLADLGPLPHGRYSHADAISATGEVAGSSVRRGYNAPSSAVVWTASP